MSSKRYDPESHDSKDSTSRTSGLVKAVALGVGGASLTAGVLVETQCPGGISTALSSGLRESCQGRTSTNADYNTAVPVMFRSDNAGETASAQTGTSQEGTLIYVPPTNDDASHAGEGSLYIPQREDEVIEENIPAKFRGSA